MENQLTFLTPTLRWLIARSLTSSNVSVSAVGALAAHRPDQARPSLPGQREDAEEIGLVEVDVQFAI